jgi:hypothetical protein
VTYTAELVQHGLIEGAHLGDKGDRSEENAMISIREQILGFSDEVVCNVGHFLDDS